MPPTARPPRLSTARKRATPRRARTTSTRGQSGQPNRRTTAPKRAKARSRQRNKGVSPLVVWMQNISPARVALGLALASAIGCVALLFDVYLGQTDPVHVAMLNAFGPLAFLVPIGAGALVIEFYRRHEGQRPWIHFEESCGALILFLSVLTLATLSGRSSSLIGNSLSDELEGLMGSFLTVVVILVLLVIGGMMTFHVSFSQLLSIGRRLGTRREHGSARSHGLNVADSDTGVDTGLLRSNTETKIRAAMSDRSTLTGIDLDSMSSAVRQQPISGLDDVPAFALPSYDLDIEDHETPEIAARALWPSPSVSLLDPIPPAIAGPADNDARAEIIERTLSSFNVAAEVVDVQSGPTVTQFGLKPAPGVRVQRITALSNDLALALAAPSIRIEAPVPGKPVVGIEIPNQTTALVTLREILESDQYARTRSPLKIALGKNVSGETVVVDLAKMPHLLIAGATGSGKSVCLNSLIACLLFHNSPERLRLLMIDPKMVELATFNGVPHLLRDVVTDMDKVLGTMKWVLKEMHRRYKLFGEAGARNISRFNEMQQEKVLAGEPENDSTKTLPYIVFIIDELADLMMTSPAEVEDSISRLAALARATGIHLILATQRPSVDVITGVIKANFPARIAFAVSSMVDSRTILDQGGAEKLLGRGDMLYLPSDGSKASRVQGTYLSDKEIERLVEFWRTNAPYQLEQIADADLEIPPAESEADVDDKLLGEATRVVREYQRASVSLLQRRLSVGYSRAARLLDQLEEHGIVGPSPDGRSRVVLDLSSPIGIEGILSESTEGALQ